MAAMQGVSLRTLQEWMGHRNFSTTLTYADYQPGAREAELVEAAFSGNKPSNELSGPEGNSESLNLLGSGGATSSAQACVGFWSRKSGCESLLGSLIPEPIRVQRPCARAPNGHQTLRKGCLG